jgi:hypothetical protein
MSLLTFEFRTSGAYGGDTTSGLTLAAWSLRMTGELESSSLAGRPRCVGDCTDSAQLGCRPVDLELERRTCFGSPVTVEFLAGDDNWHSIRDADAEAVFPNSYQVTFSIAPAWTRHVALLEAMTFRVDGRICSKAYVVSSGGSGAPKMMMLVT